MARTEKRIMISERDEIYFRQGVLIVQNLIWLAMEYLLLEWDTDLKFRLIRIIYYLFLSLGRLEFHTDPEEEIVDPYKHDGVFFSHNGWMTLQYFLLDFIAMLFMVWTFGRSIMYPLGILECTVVLVLLILPERIYSRHACFLM